MSVSVLPTRSRHSLEIVALDPEQIHFRHEGDTLSMRLADDRGCA